MKLTITFIASVYCKHEIQRIYFKQRYILTNLRFAFCILHFAFSKQKAAYLLGIGSLFLSFNQLFNC